MNDFIYMIGAGVVGGACIFTYFYLCGLIPLLKAVTCWVLCLAVFLLPIGSAIALSCKSFSEGHYILGVIQIPLSFLVLGWGWLFLWKERHDLYKDALDKSNYRLWSD